MSRIAGIRARLEVSNRDHPTEDVAYLLARLDEAVALMRKIDASQPAVPCQRCSGSGWQETTKAFLAEVDK